ncbi:MAG: hypothetical protein MZV70_41985 [Desulfobacterales bacterium]|nr:hypothetical protein [Desulfobacterales bacterium]
MKITSAIVYTPEEEAFRKNNRVLKIVLSNIIDPASGQWVLVHELLHSLGFSGHSPNIGVNLFPLWFSIIIRGSDSSQKFSVDDSGGVMSAGTYRMLEMLYRPEILQNVSQEAGQILDIETQKQNHSGGMPRVLIAGKNNWKRKKRNLEKGRVDLKRKEVIQAILMNPSTDPKPASASASGVDIPNGDQMASLKAEDEMILDGEEALSERAPNRSPVDGD